MSRYRFVFFAIKWQSLQTVRWASGIIFYDTIRDIRGEITLDRRIRFDVHQKLNQEVQPILFDALYQAAHTRAKNNNYSEPRNIREFKQVMRGRCLAKHSTRIR